MEAGKLAGIILLDGDPLEGYWNWLKTTVTIVTILQRDPDWAALPASTPRSIDRLLRRCLEKDSKRRLRDIGEARIEIDETISSPAPPEAPATQGRDQPSRWRAFTLGALVVAVVAALAVAL